MLDVLYWATKYMNAEDALLAREEKPKKRERQEDARQDRRRKATDPGTEGRIGTPNCPLEGLRVSPR